MFRVKKHTIDTYDDNEEKELLKVYLDVEVDEKLHREDEWGVCVSYYRADDAWYCEYVSDDIHIDILPEDEEYNIIEEYVFKNDVFGILKFSMG